MHTSTQWWSNVKSSPERLTEWLRKQYHGEVTAAERIERYCIDQLPFDEQERWRTTLETIAMQERKHAAWIGLLLVTRGEVPAVLDKPERYWTQTLGAIRSFKDAAAVAHHAETMRLERITVIAHDVDAPTDVREVFQKILVEEIFHARSFGQMAGADAITRAQSGHDRGLKAIGLVTAAEVM